MKKTIFAILFLSVFLGNISAVKADTTATTTLSGGGSLRAKYNIYKTEADTTDTWGSSANLFLSLIHSRQGPKGSLSLMYGANYGYDFKNDTSSWSDHRFHFNGRRNLSNRLRFNLNDTFIMTNDLWGENLSSTATGISEPDDFPDDEETPKPVFGEAAEQGDPDFSVKIGQEKFWSNSFSTNLNYQYARSGSIIVGYNNRIFEYDAPGKDNYNYHRPWVNLSYGFNPHWNTSLSYSYTDAQFDLSQDFIDHDAGVNLNYYRSVHDTFFAGLRYYEKEYETIEPPDISVVRSDYYTARANIGWTHNFSPYKTLSLAWGPAYLNYVDQDDYWTHYFDFSYTSEFEKGSWFIQANGGFDDRAFDGLNEGVSEYQRLSTGVGWQVTKEVSASLGASLRNDGFLENPLTSDEKTYAAYANLSYRFWRWFYVSGRYWYVNADRDLNGTDSEEHRFFITLGASKELYRWIH